MTHRSSDPGRGKWRNALQLLTGMAIMVGAGMSIRFVSGQVKWKSLPAGWQIIRPPHEVSALALLDDTVWAGGRDGLHRIDRTSGQLLPSPEGTPHLRYVRDLLVDGEGRLWIAHGGGVMIHPLDLWQPLAAEAGAKARSLLEDEQGRLWFGSEYNGLAIRDAEAWRYLSIEDGLADVEVKDIVQDQDGVFWLGTVRSSGPTWSTLL